ncbi:Endogenous retrovirus group K member 24 Env polyprotein [Plecturocebus cupreus]
MLEKGLSPEGCSEQNKEICVYFNSGNNESYSYHSYCCSSWCCFASCVQTASFVDNWQKNSSKLWNSQSQINQKLANLINGLRQMLVWMGDRLMSLEQRLHVQCDWNTSEFCITPSSYNATEHHWEMVKCHLQGKEGNLTLGIARLKKEIFQASQAHLTLFPGTDVLAGVADSLSNINPLRWMKAF